jgi:lipopolysaccharide heptosyltransferase II
LKNYKKILIVHTAFIGDIVLITPLIRETNFFFPEATVDVLVVPETKGVLVNNPHIGEIITFNKRKNKIKAFVQTLKILRKKNYELAILPHSSSTTIYLMLFGGIAQRLGFNRRHAAKYLTMKVPYVNGQNWHVTKKNLNLLSVFGQEDFILQTEVFPSQQDFEKADSVLNKISQNQSPVIVVAPGSVRNTKKWPERHYKALTKMLAQNKYNLVFIGSKAEFVLCKNIIESATVDALNLAGKTTILESAAIIQRSDLIVCNDSATLHLANAVKTDVFTFFGPTVTDFGFFPYRKGDQVFEVDVNCRPCGYHGGKQCPLEHHRCMKEIQPEFVLNSIQKKLGPEKAKNNKIDYKTIKIF